MIVKIKFIRHACSYGNIISALGGMYSILHKFYYDPMLTEFGKLSCSSETKKEKVDIVCCSLLSRAIETALYMYPVEKIHVVPFVIESSYGLDNCVSSIETHKQLFSMNLHSKISYDYVMDTNGKYTDDAVTSNYQRFMSFIKITLLPSLKGNNSKLGLSSLPIPSLNNNKSNQNILNTTTTTTTPTNTTFDTSPQDQDEINIIVITHSHFMYKNLENVMTYPKNNTIVEQIYEYDNNESELKLLSSTVIYEGVNLPNIDEFHASEAQNKNNNNTIYNNFLWKLMFGQSIEQPNPEDLKDSNTQSCQIQIKD